MTISRRVKILAIMVALAANSFWQGWRLRAQTTVAPDQIRAPRFVAMACVAPGTANADCSGLVYIDAVTPAGKEIKLIGVPPATPIDPAAWSIIP